MVEVCSELVCNVEQMERPAKKQTPMDVIIDEDFSSLSLYMQPKPEPPLGSALKPMSRHAQIALRERTRDMFTFAYDSYLIHGLPAVSIMILRSYVFQAI
jgi:hypothetical protein